jgi:plastocyanin
MIRSGAVRAEPKKGNEHVFKMKIWLRLGALLLACGAPWACSKEQDSGASPEPATSATTTAPAPGGEDRSRPGESNGAIFGKVIFKGDWRPSTIAVSRDREVCGKDKLDPALSLSSQGEVRNAVVYIKEIEGGKAMEPRKVVLDQKGCEYRPHVLAFSAGSTVEILNPDGILHNVHTQSKLNAPFNLAQPKFKTSMEVKIDKPEIIAIKCDVHPWMSGWLFVAGNPYYSVTDESGGFALSEIDPSTGAFLGNYPQAFSHIGVISSGVNLARLMKKGAAP